MVLTPPGRVSEMMMVMMGLEEGGRVRLEREGGRVRLGREREREREEERERWNLPDGSVVGSVTM